LFGDFFPLLGRDHPHGPTQRTARWTEGRATAGNRLLFPSARACLSVTVIRHLPGGPRGTANAELGTGTKSRRPQPVDQTNADRIVERREEQVRRAAGEAPPLWVEQRTVAADCDSHLDHAHQPTSKPRFSHTATRTRVSAALEKPRTLPTVIALDRIDAGSPHSPRMVAIGILWAKLCVALDSGFFF